MLIGPFFNLVMRIMFPPPLFPLFSVMRMVQEIFSVFPAFLNLFPSGNNCNANSPLNHFSVFSGLMRMIKGKKFSEKAFKKGKKANANSPIVNDGSVIQGTVPSASL